MPKRVTMPSRIDKIFKDVFGYIPNKEGSALEMFSAIAMDNIFTEHEAHKISYDQKIMGQHSGTTYQIDAQAQKKDLLIIGEAKDYTSRNSKNKVGRADLQKLGGALPDLRGVIRGIFFSATEYTTPAKKYAENAEKIIGKPMELFHLHQFEEKDKEGTVQKIIITLSVLLPLMDKGVYAPILTELGNQQLLKDLSEGESLLHGEISEFYNAFGEVIETVYNLTRTQRQEEFSKDTMTAKGVYELIGHFIKINGKLIEITAISYEIPFKEIIQVFQVEENSEKRLTIKDKNGEVIAILSDKKLRQYSFDKSGNLTKGAINRIR